MKNSTAKNSTAAARLLVASLLIAPPALAQSGAAQTSAPSTPASARTPTVTVRSDEGTVTVPRDPRRVIVLDEESLQLLDALGIKPVGTGSGRLSPADIAADGTIRADVARAGFLGRGDLSGVQYVGNWITPNLEKILSLKPDLIIHETWQGNTAYPGLSKIAPTFGYREDTAGYWQTPFRAVASLFGKQVAAERVIREVAQAQQQGRAQLQQAGVFRKYPRAVVISPFSGGTTYINSSVRFIEDVKALGFKSGYTPRSETVLGIGQVISDEALLGLDPQTLVIVVSPSAEAASSWQATPVGQRLRAQTLVYTREANAPWSGPLVSLRTSQELPKLILAK